MAAGAIEFDQAAVVAGTDLLVARQAQLALPKGNVYYLHMSCEFLLE